MSETLEEFLKRHLPAVEVDGRRCERILLAPLNDAGEMEDPFERFDAPFRTAEGGPGPEKLGATIRDLVTGYAYDWPKGQRITFVVLCQDKDDNTRGKHFLREKGANPDIKKGPGGAVGLMDGVGVLVKGMREMMAISSSQNHLFAEQSKTLIESQTALILMLTNERLKAAESAGEASSASDNTELVIAINELSKRVVPLAKAIFGEVIMSSKPTNGAGTSAPIPPIPDDAPS
jgi:hypothetical protein